jgi:hypothetical protein
MAFELLLFSREPTIPLLQYNRDGYIRIDPMQKCDVVHATKS